MQSIKLKVLDREGHTYLTCAEGERVSLVHTSAYREGDRIALECCEPGCWCFVQLEDSLAPALVYVARREINYAIPFGQNRIVFSPKAFTGERHLIRAWLASPEEIAAYNAIDGIYENASHGEWPYQSWGINRDPNAAWTLSFGTPVEIDELRVTLRADFPHDSWWTQGTVVFSDGSEETLSFVKTEQPQSFPIAPRRVEWLTFQKLIKNGDPSPFPALTQFEAWGKPV